MTDRTFDYDGESAVPEPISQLVKGYLGKSISFSDVLTRLLRGWHFALVGVVVGALIGAYVIWITPPSYTVSLTLLPLDTGSAEIDSGADSGLGILMGLLGSTGGPLPKMTRYIDSLYSTGLATAMDKKYGTSCMIFSCDKKTKRVRPSTGFWVGINRTIDSLARLPDRDHPRTAADLSKYIYNYVSINSDEKFKMLVLSMETGNPPQASQFLLQLNDAANEYMKDQDNEVVKKEIAYISGQLRTNPDVSQRDALIKMLDLQEQHLMVTAVNLPYALAVQDGPSVATSNRSIKYFMAITVGGLLIGGAIGIALSFVPESKRFWRIWWKRSGRPSP